MREVAYVIIFWTCISYYWKHTKIQEYHILVQYRIWHFYFYFSYSSHLIVITCIFDYNHVNLNNAYAQQEEEGNHKKFTIIIPKGSANPE